MIKIGTYVRIAVDSSKDCGNLYSAGCLDVEINGLPDTTIFKVLGYSTYTTAVSLWPISGEYGTEHEWKDYDSSYVEQHHLKSVGTITKQKVDSNAN